jgi:A118 family predicted phage portal protein
MFEKIRGIFMNFLNYFHTYKIEDLTGVETNITGEMYNRISLWADMMSGRAPWNTEAKPCGILPQIAGRLNYFVTREIGLAVENEAIKKPMKNLNANIGKVVEYITFTGAGLLRPIYAANKLQYEIIPLGNYLPTGYDFDGTLTGAIIIKQIAAKKKNYLLCEIHNYDGLNHNVEMKLYENTDGTLRQVPLTSCEQTASLTPEYTWNNCGRPMIIEYRSNVTNKIDGSNVPVALIDDAIDLIEKADRQFARMDWEQEAGEKRIFADRDMFMKRTSRNGDTDTVVLSKSLNKLIQKIDGDGSANGEKIHEYSPELRTTAQNEYLQQVFRRIELTLNVGKGTVSDAESVQQTATQYSGGRQELFAIVDKIEDEIAAKYEDTALVFAYMASAYGLQGAPAVNAKPEELYTIKWNDDQTRKDIQQAKLTALQEISAGVLNKWEYRHDFYGEDEAQAKANVPPEPVAPDPFNFGA